MAESAGSEGIVLDTGLIVRSVRYYAIIGGGLGLLGIILLLQLGGGGEAIISGLLSFVILSFAVLCGPIIAAFVGYATANGDNTDLKQSSINSGIANGIGFAIFGIVVSILLWIGLAVVLGGGGGGTGFGSSGSGGPLELGNLITLIVLMMLPNALVGGGITFFLEDRTIASINTVRPRQDDPEIQDTSSETPSEISTNLPDESELSNLLENVSVVLSNVSIVRGLLFGTLSFVLMMVIVGLITYIDPEFVITGGTVSPSFVEQFGLDPIPMNLAKIFVWVIMVAHGVTVSNLEYNLVRSGLLLLAPVIAIGIVGFLHAERSDYDSITDAIGTGVTVTIGYALLIGILSIFATASVEAGANLPDFIENVHLNVSVNVISAVFRAGILYPVVLGSAGAIVSILRDRGGE